MILTTNILQIFSKHSIAFLTDKISKLLRQHCDLVSSPSVKLPLQLLAESGVSQGQRMTRSHSRTKVEGKLQDNESGRVCGTSLDAGESSKAEGDMDKASQQFYSRSFVPIPHPLACTLERVHN